LISHLFFLEAVLLAHLIRISREELTGACNGLPKKSKKIKVMLSRSCLEIKLLLETIRQPIQVKDCTAAGGAWQAGKLVSRTRAGVFPLISGQVNHIAALSFKAVQLWSRGMKSSNEGNALAQSMTLGTA